MSLKREGKKNWEQSWAENAIITAKKPGAAMEPVPAGSATPRVVTRIQQTKTDIRVMFLSYRSVEPLNC